MDVKKCHKCNVNNPIAASFCRNCGEPFSEESKKGEILKPRIKECVVMSSNYTIGSSVEIMWDVENASEISINGEIVTGQEKYDYYVEASTTLELVASNEFAKDVHKIAINPSPLPKIYIFEASKKKVRRGEKIKISIDFKAQRAVLHSNKSTDIDISGKKVIEVIPQLDEKYELICFSIDENVKVIKELELYIIDNVCIDCFQADRSEVIESLPITLSWKVHNATSMILFPDRLDVTGKDSITLCPNRSVTYQLQVSNELSTASKFVSVGVRPLPRLQYSMPTYSDIFNMPNIDLGIDSLHHISETRIDRWLISPVNAKKESELSYFITQIKKLFRLDSLYKMKNIPTGALVAVKGLKIALLIIAALILFFNTSQVVNCETLWAQILSGVCAVFNILYIYVVLQITKTRNLEKLKKRDLWIGYALLCTSSISTIILVLCNGDYSLYNSSDIYILLESSGLILPIVLLIFYAITYWLPMNYIYTIHKKLDLYNNIKATI